MNKEIKLKWVEALRSGKYKKGTGFLHRADSFCCLGVLCDLQGCKWEKGSKSIHTIVMDGGHYESIIPDTISENVDFARGQQVRLAKLNDGGWSFEQIADLIEQEY